MASQTAERPSVVTALTNYANNTQVSLGKLAAELHIAPSLLEGVVNEGVDLPRQERRQIIRFLEGVAPELCMSPKDLEALPAPHPNRSKRTGKLIHRRRMAGLLREWKALAPTGPERMQFGFNANALSPHVIANQQQFAEHTVADMERLVAHLRELRGVVVDAPPKKPRRHMIRMDHKRVQDAIFGFQALHITVAQAEAHGIRAFWKPKWPYKSVRNDQLEKAEAWLKELEARQSQTQPEAEVTRSVSGANQDFFKGTIDEVAVPVSHTGPEADWKDPFTAYDNLHDDYSYLNRNDDATEAIIWKAKYETAIEVMTIMTKGLK